MNQELQAAKDLVEEARAGGRAALDEEAGKRLLSLFGVRTPKSTLVRDAREAKSAVARMRAPFVAKVVSAQILHKSDAGGVALNLSDPAAVRHAIGEMAQKPKIAAAAVEGWLVEEMIPPGREVVIGAVRDPQFGPMIMVGLGGIFVEVLKDVSFRICPIDQRQARAMLSDLKGEALLDGVRGEAPVDKDALVDVMLRIGGADGLLMTLGDEIAEADLNPIIVSPSGAVAVDARFILSFERGQA